MLYIAHIKFYRDSPGHYAVFPTTLSASSLRNAFILFGSICFGYEIGSGFRADIVMVGDFTEVDPSMRRYDLRDEADRIALIAELEACKKNPLTNICPLD